MAGQLDYCLDHGNRFTAVLLGFNPPSMARLCTAAALFNYISSCIVGRNQSETGIKHFTMVKYVYF